MMGEVHALWIRRRGEDTIAKYYQRKRHRKMSWMEAACLSN
jgi:hypothetical protein